MKEKNKNKKSKSKNDDEKLNSPDIKDKVDGSEEEIEDDFFINEEKEDEYDENNGSDVVQSGEEDIEKEEESNEELEKEDDLGEDEDVEDSEDELTAEEKKIICEKKLEAMKKKIKKSGVVYLSRIPPYMKPEKLKSLLEKYCKINRMYIVPEDESSYRRRVKKGGNRNRKYIEGWIEFVDKKKAKLIAETLNNQQIGGKKRSYYHDDIWNMKYLKGFKWTHLTEKMRYEKIIREQKLKAELSQKTKATVHYLINSEKDEKRSKFLERLREGGEKIKAPERKRKIPQKSSINSESFPLPKKAKIE